MQQIAEIRQEAEEACGRCMAKSYDACSPQCRYFMPLATAMEREAAMRPESKPIRSKREWLGPVRHDYGTVVEEAA